MSEQEEIVDETLDKIAELLNEALVSNKDTVRVTNLRHVQELILQKNPALLDSFLDEILQFQLDKSVEVKKIVITFIEEACKRDLESIFKVIDNFRYLLFDENVNVQKRAYLSMINIFKSTLKWMEKNKSNIDEDQHQAWLSIVAIKDHIISQIDSDNDGVRTTAIKFVEMIIISLSPRIKESMIPSINEWDISLDQISDDHPILNKTALQEEGRICLRKLLDYTLSTHISSVNLISSVCVLSSIAKQRPEFMEIVLETYKNILENIPPTLGKSQVSTVKKQMKLQVLLICKNSCCIEFQSQITQILNELGASQSEISKCLPKVTGTDSKKRAPSTNETSSSSKRPKTQIMPLNSRSSLVEGTTAASSKQTSAPTQQQQSELLPTLEEIVEDFSKKLVVRENITDLVMVSMAFLPDQMPLEFARTYKPISDAGTNNQIKNLAQLLAVFLSELGVLKLKNITANQLDDDDDDLDENEEGVGVKSNLTRIKSEKIESLAAENQRESQMITNKPTGAAPKPLPNLQSILPKCTNKTFKLAEVTSSSASQFTSESLEELLFKTHNRILQSDEMVSKSKEASLVRKRILVETTSLANYDNHLLNYIFEDVRKRIDLGLVWIFNNYINLKKACRHKKKQVRAIKHSADEDVFELQNEEKIEKDIQKYELEYDKTLYTILFSLQNRQEPKDLLFSKIICQVPLLTENCLKLLKTFCQDENKFYFSMSTLCDLVLTRISQRNVLLKLLFELTHNQNSLIRENAITITLRLHERQEFKNLIEDFAIEQLRSLVLPSPPASLFTEIGKDEALDSLQWTENSIKACLYLYLSLMTSNHRLIHPLTKIFICSISEVKRTILKMLETPVKSMSMESNELLKLIEDFPNGAETLVLRIIHILTEKTMPSIELVNRVRFLYENKLSDVRFLIPILSGLTKKEIVTALPSLIKLSPAVVKEVFNRLLGPTSPITPAELLIALHKIDPTLCDLKTVINATSICFGEKTIYNQEVLATVMQQLIDVTPIPTLYMRTVIQSVSVYPKLTGFVMIMMQRLIGKQIWKYPKVWEGFVKCCQKIKPVCHQVLFQLPPAQLKEVFKTAPDLKEHVCKHVQSMNPQQKIQIPEKLMELIDQQVVLIHEPAAATTV